MDIRLVEVFDDSGALAEADRILKILTELQKEGGEVGVAITSAFNKAGASSDAFTQSVKKTTDEVMRLSKELGDGGTDAIELARGMQQLKKTYTELQQAATTLRGALKNATDPTVIALYSKELAKAEVGLKQLEKGAKQAGVSLKDLQKEAGVGKQVVGELLSAFSVAGVVAGVGALVKHAVDLAKNYEVARASFTAFLGDAAKADKVLAELTDFAARTPLSGEEVNAAGKALLAFGESADSLVPTLSRIGDIAKGTGKDFGELTTIYGKARTAGVLYAEDINQLVEAGVPIIQEFAKQMGVSNDQVKKLASEGKIGFSQLELAFFNLTSEGGKFYGQLNAFSDTLQGKTDNLSASFDRLLLKLGSLFGPALKKVVDLLSSGLDRIDDAFSNFGEGGLIESSLKGASNAAYFLSGGLIDIKVKSKEAAKELSNVGKEFLTGQKQAPEFGPVLTGDQRKRAELQKAANDERQRLDSAANTKLSEGRAKAAESEAKRRKAEHERALKEEEQFNKETNDLRLSLLDPKSEQFAIVKELQRFDEQRAAFIKHNLATEEIEKQHTKNLLEIQIKYFLERAAKVEQSLQDERDSVKRGFDELAAIDAENVEARKAGIEKILKAQEDLAGFRQDIFEGQLLDEKAAFYAHQRTDEEIEEYEKEVAKKKEAFQLEQQRVQLQNQLEFNKSLSDTQKAGLQQQIENIDKQLGQLAAGTGDKDKKKKPVSILSFLGIDPDSAKGKAITEVANEVISAINSVLEADLRAAELRTSTKQKEYDEAKSLLEQQQQNARDGNAADIQGAKDTLAQRKAAVEAAFEDEKKIRRQQFALETATQLSSLATGAAKTLAAFPGPLLPIGIGLVALMFASFAIAKSKALQAINQDKPKLRKGKFVEGPTHEGGGVPHTSVDGRTYEVEGKEAIIGTEQSKEHEPFLRAMIGGKFKGVNLNSLVKEVGRQAPSPLSDAAPRAAAQQRRYERAKQRHQYSAMVTAYRQETTRVVDAINEKPVVYPWKDGYKKAVTKGKHTEIEVRQPGK